MEELMCKTVPQSIQDETMNRSLGLEGQSESMSSTLIGMENFDLDTKEEKSNGINGHIDVNPESVCDPKLANSSESLQQKPYSPTLIESAFKAMKNLFSPDKTRSKPANVIYPAKPSLSNSGSPTSSICIKNKMEFSTAGPETENSLQTGESGILVENQLNINQMRALFSPLPVESHNNTDESFSTTVSIIDDSFHSAITHLEENGETVNSDSNLMDSILNSTQNSDVGDPYNDTLQNTTLKSNSFVLDSTKLDGVSVCSKDGNSETWNSFQLNGCNGSFSDDKTQQKEVNCTNGKKNSVHAEPIKKGLPENPPIGKPNKSVILNAEQTQTKSDLNNEVKNIKMKNLFLNKSFRTSIDASEPIGDCLESNNVNQNDFIAIEKDKPVALNFNDPQPAKESEICVGLNNEGELCLENNISTTTIVLNSAESVDLDNLLASLKEDSSDASTISSLTSLRGSVLTMITSPEVKNEMPDPSQCDQFPENTSYLQNSEGIAFAPLKSEINKMGRGEIDSLGSGSNKVRSHKSDELINRRMSGKSPDGKKNALKKSLDVTLMKNSEATKKRSSGASTEFKENLGTSEPNLCGNNKLKDTTSNEQTLQSVISQQSYTILTTHNKSLNRPVIEPMNADKDSSEKNSFHTSNSTFTAEKGSEEGIVKGNYCNNSLGAADLASTPQQKQSTPLWKGNKRNSLSKNCQGKPISLNLSSSESAPRQNEKKDQFSIKSEALEKTIPIFNSNEDPAEFSPVNPINENELIFSNSIENEVGGNQCFGTSDLNNTKVLSPKDTREPKLAVKPEKLDEVMSEPLNQTYDKKPRPSGSNKSSGTLENNAGGEKLNLTFDKSRSSLSNNSNKTYTKESESSEIGRTDQTFNVLESPECNEINKTFDKTYVGKECNNKAGPGGLEILNLTFDGGLQPSSLPTIGDPKDPVSTPTVPTTSNQTFVKESQLDNNQQLKEVPVMNKTFENVPHADVTFVKSVETPEVEVVDKQTKTSKCPTEEMPIDQQISDGIDGYHRDTSGSFVSGKSSNNSLVGSELSALLLSEGSLSRNQSLDDLAGKLGKLNLNDSSSGKAATNGMLSEVVTPSDDITTFPLSISPPEQTPDKMKCDPYLVQLIQEQFTSTDIEKICAVVDDISSMKLSSQILKASEQFDKSFHENLSNAELKPPATEANPESKPDKFINPLSPKSFDFLSSIQGKPTGRDWSRESLYVKFDPLVQPNPNSLIDFTKEGEALPSEEKSPAIAHDSSVCEQLLAISPQKKPDDIVPPLTPLSHRSKSERSEDKTERVKELQNEIYFLKNLYAERERTNKAKMEEYESQVAKLTGESCFLENKLKESNEREKALVKKMKEQTHGLGQLKIIMEEYVKVISNLTAELETLKSENQKQIETLSAEKDSYMTHLQNTEAAFTDVHAKYEKSKKTIVSLKSNEMMYRNTITEQAQKMEDLKSKAREAQEKAMKELQKMEDELNETKGSHNQETARLRAQLRKTELKVEALQESLEQKIKENQQLTAICDELIEGKK